jgi:2-methylcitrate dehydratase
MVKHESLKRTAEPEKFCPTDRETADHSLPACVAMGLLDGHLTPDQFEANRFLDKDVVDLIGKTEAIVGPDFEERFPHGRPGAVRVYLNDGSQHEVLEERAFGDPERPFDQHALHEKFMGLVEPKLGSASAWRIVEFVNDLETLPDLKSLMNELAGRV